MIRTIFFTMTFAVVVLFSHNVFAGTWYEAWGKDPGIAMEKALKTAVENSAGGCLCKDWSNDIEKDCKMALGGVVCKACGSNHKGSCSTKEEVYFENAKKARDLILSQ